ncbi:alkaline phosphatase D family protein [Streptomonospora sediminis]
MGIGLRLGPLLRHVTDTTATIWVETEAPCLVTVTAGEHTAQARTFTVHGHHYALCDLEGLPIGAALPYEVHLDGETVWPAPGSHHPPSQVRTLDSTAISRILFGSCHKPSGTSREDLLHYGVDMLRAYSQQLAAARSGAPASSSEAGLEADPSVLLLIGDQIYADELETPMKEYLAKRRAQIYTPGAGHQPPADEVVSFDEYAELYRQSWTDPDIRWLMSTVPTFMLFDDHDICDDWNTSGAWRAQMGRNPWWRPRITAGLGAYWIYQHVGNLSAAQRAADPVFTEIVESGAPVEPATGQPEADQGTAGQVPGSLEAEAAADAQELPDYGQAPTVAPTPAPGAAPVAEAAPGDGAAALDSFAWRVHQEPDTYRWSFRLDIGRSRILMIDTRCGRDVEDDAQRRMLSPQAGKWLEEQITGDVDHLVLASTLPFLLPMGIHHVEAWNEAVCAGVWGKGLRGVGEKIRQEVDLEHWAAFQGSFQSVGDAVLEVIAGERGAAPASVLFLGGDVHFSYLARARYSTPGHSTLAQLVCSPTCNRMAPMLREATWLSARAVAGMIGAGLARMAGVAPPRMRWRMEGGPWYANSLATLVLDGRRAEVAWSTSPLTKRAAKRLTPNESPKPVVRELARHDLTH